MSPPKFGVRRLVAAFSKARQVAPTSADKSAHSKNSPERPSLSAMCCGPAATVTAGCRLDLHRQLKMQSIENRLLDGFVSNYAKHLSQSALVESSDLVT